MNQNLGGSRTKEIFHRFGMIALCLQNQASSSTTTGSSLEKSIH
ncbi:hypothetical protein HanPSC8_Chr03g0098451 [Helianthus annuus]|nr:hypothetical protein HanPSC8_Chr03g0098451 [Helianthus annuus]